MKILSSSFEFISGVPEGAFTCAYMYEKHSEDRRYSKICFIKQKLLGLCLMFNLLSASPVQYL